MAQPPASLSIFSPDGDFMFVYHRKMFMYHIISYHIISYHIILFYGTLFTKKKNICFFHQEARHFFRKTLMHNLRLHGRSCQAAKAKIKRAMPQTPGSDSVAKVDLYIIYIYMYIQSRSDLTLNGVCINK